MFLLFWVAVNLHSVPNVWGCTCMSAQDQTSLVNVLSFSVKPQPLQWVNALPSTVCLSSQHAPLRVNRGVFPPAVGGTSLCAPVLCDWGCTGAGLAVQPLKGLLPQWNASIVPWSHTTAASTTCPQAKMRSLSLIIKHFNINFHLHLYCSYREDLAV